MSDVQEKTRKLTASERHFAQMYLALKRISLYQPPERLKRRASKDWGLDDGNEAVEMAYENVISEAKAGLRGVRRPAPLKIQKGQGVGDVG